MGLLMFIKKKFKWDEPLELTIIASIALGAMPAHAPQPQYRPFFIFWGKFILVIYTLFLISTATNVFVAEDFFNECLESIHFYIVSIHVLAKYASMKIYEPKFVELLNDIKTAWKFYEPRHRQYLSRSLSSINTVSMLISTSLMNIPTVNVIGAAVNSYLDPDHIHLPLQIWIPSFLRERVIFGSIVQVSLMYPPLAIVAMTSMFLNSVSRHVEVLGLCLARNIKESKKWSTADAEKWYREHQEIIRIVLVINKLMARNWGVEMVCAAFQITLPAYRALRAMKHRDIYVFNHIFIVCMNIMVIYLIFRCGDRILSMGEEIKKSLYEAKWYNSPVSDRKNFLISLARATYPIEYAYKFVKFDLPTFTKVVNAVLSYMAVLQFLDEATSHKN